MWFNVKTPAEETAEYMHKNTLIVKERRKQAVVRFITEIPRKIHAKIQQSIRDEVELGKFEARIPFYNILNMKNEVAAFSIEGYTISIIINVVNAKHHTFDTSDDSTIYMTANDYKEILTELKPEFVKFGYQMDFTDSMVVLSW